MSILSRIRELSFSRLWRLGWIGIQNPLMVWPTFKATKKTMEICDALFGKAHHRNNSSNSFRHALWNILICKNAFQVMNDGEKAISWAEKITSLHEKLMPNNALEEAMDLHNNELGRIYFGELENTSEEEIVHFLKLKMDEAIKISEVSEIQNHRHNLVYIV
ncbi:hypothetical protein QRD02_02355 [Aequorivita sp. SDUM287046]|uniref:DUF6973 domain-containing protein n=1 Tax=Aequorivita aurantiaca TaxID=3053356 RepID=A0ABT8DDC4_9FLAO|nr:hypothetical protein [Aequorivita aurantiaca]MDN3723210.1 hypothetical protein [Aequorivita aurantiaca]